MRTAEQILKDNNVVGMTELMIPIINEARKEAMNEVSKKVCETNMYNGGNTIINDRIKERINSLIDKVK